MARRKESERNWFAQQNGLHPDVQKQFPSTQQIAAILKHTHTHTRSTWPFRLKSLQVNSACYQKQTKNSTDQRSKTNDITKRNQKKNLAKKENQTNYAIDKTQKKKGENQTLLNQRHLDLYRVELS